MSHSLSIGFIQADLYWENADANLAMFEEEIWQLKDETDVIILPEMFTTGFSMDAARLAEPMKTRTFRWMKQIAAQRESLVIGSYIIKEQTTYRNRLFCVYPDGQYQYYDKRHLFSLAGEDEQYTAGDTRLIVDWKGWRIMPLICYDLRFPVWSRSQDYEYDLLVYIANWPTPRVNAWDTLLQARAIENQCYVAGVNRIGEDGYGAKYNGHSAIVDYLGEYVCTPQDERQLAVASIDQAPMKSFREKYNFQKESDRFTITD